MNKKRIVGFILISFGFVLVLNSLSNITGFVISEMVGKTPSSIFGLIFLISGLALLLIGREEREGGLVQIVRTKRFEKSIRKHDPKEIEVALSKIGTGLANEKYLKHKGHWSLKTTKGGRITYERKGNEIILLNYFPHHY